MFQDLFNVPGWGERIAPRRQWPAIMRVSSITFDSKVFSELSSEKGKGGEGRGGGALVSGPGGSATDQGMGFEVHGR